MVIADRASTMNNDAKNMSLCMIPYGIYVLTATDSECNVAAATVDRITQICR